MFLLLLLLLCYRPRNDGHYELGACENSIQFKSIERASPASLRGATISLSYLGITASIFLLRSAVPLLLETDRSCNESAIEQQTVFGIREESLSTILCSRPQCFALDGWPSDAPLHEGPSSRGIQRRSTGELEGMWTCFPPSINQSNDRLNK